MDQGGGLVALPYDLRVSTSVISQAISTHLQTNNWLISFPSYLTKLHIYYKNFLLYWERNMSENIFIKNKFNKYFEPLPKRESR